MDEQYEIISRAIPLHPIILIEIHTISKDDLENIGRALALEEKVVVFYERLIDKTSDPGIKALFELFVNNERKHRQFLKDTKEFVVKAGFVE